MSRVVVLVHIIKILYWQISFSTEYITQIVCSYVVIISIVIW
jgi:hypothetical protein